MRFPLWLLALGLPSALGAQGRPPGWTAPEWMTLKNAEWPAISPDGGTVAYRIHAPDREGGKDDAQIWTVSTRTGQQRQITTGNGSSWAPAWSPDGRRIAYLSSQGKGTQVYLIPAGGGEPIQLTSAANGVDGFRWSPDGRRIAFVGGEAGPPPGSAAVAPAPAV